VRQLQHVDVADGHLLFERLTRHAVIQAGLAALLLEAGIPESFNVLMKELQSLCLNVELLEDPTAPRKTESPSAGVPAGLAALAREVAEKVGSAQS
jgi:hypothetical protein